ncbi:MAG TPA: MerR family transcriptional regulator [Acidimicrobiia bacterium]|nr:MerR family transcriptional regulator [Acidimicrobiia bacterium]
MARTVGEVARLTGLTVRTLHHYDEIGLLVPAGRTEAGYRMYGEAELIRLHDILVWREMGIPLEEIARLLDDPGYDMTTSLRRHREQLAARATEIERRIERIDGLIEKADGGMTMDDDFLTELFEGFDPTVHRDEAQRRWGSTEAYEVSRRRAVELDADEWRRIKREGDEITEGFARLLRDGVPVDSEQAARLVKTHRDHLSQFYPVSAEMHRGLGEMYVDDPRFQETYDSVEPGLARYVRDAIRAVG